MLDLTYSKINLKERNDQDFYMYHITSISNRYGIQYEPISYTQASEFSFIFMGKHMPLLFTIGPVP